MLPPKLHKPHGSLQHGAGGAHKAPASLNRRSPALAPKPPLAPPHTTVPLPINTSSKERLQVRHYASPAALLIPWHAPFTSQLVSYVSMLSVF